jgi:antitoxin component HigA of HigAB toxin-antitoxin module
MSDFLEHWANDNPENAKLVAQELLITEVTEAIWEVMENAGITKSELASRMGATKGYVSQVLNGARNMTLRTLSDICFALGRQPQIRVEARPQQADWQTCTSGRVAIGPAKLRYQSTGNVIYPMDHWPKAA